MKTAKIALTAILAVSLAAALFQATQNSANNFIPGEVITQFHSWRQKHSKIYSTPNEEKYRLKVFYDNLKHIEAVNKAQSDSRQGINLFADLTSEEFLCKYTSGGVMRAKEDDPEGNCPQLPTDNLPKSIDWRSKGAVTPVVLVLLDHRRPRGAQCDLRQPYHLLLRKVVDRLFERIRQPRLPRRSDEQRFQVRHQQGYRAREGLPLRP